MSRRALQAFVRAASAAPVGLHAGEITCLPSLLRCVATPFSVQSHAFQSGVFFDNGNMKKLQNAMRGWRQGQVRTYAAAAVPTAAEEYDLLPPDTGIVRIEGYDGSGFIVSDVQVEGSILCFGDLWLSWSAHSIADVTIESLKVVDLLKPLPELLVLGCGTTIKQVPVELVQALKERDISIEVLDTVNAVATFNILNQEGRKVVGAMLPAGLEE